MGDAYEQFGLLLSSVWSGQHSATLFTRFATPESELRFGADTAGQRHVLAPITDEYAFTPHRGAELELSDWTDPQSRQRYLDLICKSEPLAQVFCALADSIIDRIQTRHEPPHVAVLGALTDWRRLLRPARELTEEAARGLYGELFILKRLAGRNPLYAVDSWTGPDRMVHDFTTPNGELEVKSSAREGLDVVISSLDQLDTVADAPLTLVRVHVEASPSGQCLEDLVNELITLGVLRSTLIERLAVAGFLLGVDADTYRFTSPSVPMSWEITDAFPGLRTTDLPENRRGAITRLTYNLSLVGAPGQLSSEQFDSFLDRMMIL